MKLFIVQFSLLLLLAIPVQSQKNEYRITNLTCEYIHNPLGIVSSKPRLSWNIVAGQRNFMQRAYQILVASNSLKLAKDEADLWNSGWINSGECINLKYNGVPLKSRQACWWKVRVKDKSGTTSQWSNAGKWLMGIINTPEWKGKWIASDIVLKDYQLFLRNFTDFGMEPESEIWDWAPKIRKMTDTVETAPAAYLRKEFTSEKHIKSAIVSICGLGLYELYLNGNKISNDLINPAPTDYQKQVLYSTYNISNQVKNGLNTIGVILGNGWYNLVIPHVLRYYAADYIAPPKLLFELNINYTDGTSKTIISDESWKFSTNGPIQFNSLLGGETYNATKEMPGWNSNGFNEKSWKGANITDKPEGKPMPQLLYPVEKLGSIKAVNITKKSDTIVVDFGKELTGWAKIKVKGEKGETIKILYPGAPTHTLGRYQTCKYVFKGAGEEIYEPRFCYMGFQTIEIIGLGYTPQLSDFTAEVVATNMPSVGNFSCSNEKINKLQEILLHTMRNYVTHIPNDPTREKAGWTQDVQNAFDVMAYNFDCEPMYAKWQQDFLDIQHSNGYVPPVIPGRFDGLTINGPWWGGMIVYLPWKLYEYFDNKEILEASYPYIQKYLLYLESISENNIISWGLGDWLEPGSVRPVKTPVPLTSTIAYYYYTTIASQTAKILGKTDDAILYSDKANQIKINFNKKFLNETTGEYALGSQASQLMPLLLGLVPSDKDSIVRAALLEQIKKDDMHLSTGFVSTPFLLNGLAELGYPEIAYQIATQNTYPSWFDMVFNHGQSVFKETWAGGEVQMPSLGGSVGSWFFYSLAGIKQDKLSRGFKNIIINPVYNSELTYVNATYKCLYGEIESSWAHENNTFSITVEIPANTNAKVYLPTNDSNSITESGKNIMDIKDIILLGSENNKTVLQIGSGRYSFKIN